MAWTTPKTNWATGELVTAEDMNAVGENLVALKHPVTAVYTLTEDISISNSGTFVDFDSDNLNLTITTTGGDVLAHFHGTVSHSGLRLDIDVDGVRQGDAEYGIRRGGVTKEMVSFTRLIRGLSPGIHIFKLQGRNAPATLLAGAQFWVREI